MEECCVYDIYQVECEAELQVNLHLVFANTEFWRIVYLQIKFSAHENLFTHPFRLSVDCSACF